MTDRTLSEEIAAEMARRARTKRHPGTPEETGAVPSDSNCSPSGSGA